MSEFSSTRQYVYKTIRSAVSADDTALDGTTASVTFQFADKPAAAVEIVEGMNAAQLIFYGTDAADETCNYKVYAYREQGPAQLVCTGVVTLGAAKKSATEFYADTITATGYWPKDVVVSDAAGAGRVASLSFDLLGCRYVYVEFDIPASAQVATISCDVSGF